MINIQLIAEAGIFPRTNTLLSTDITGKGLTKDSNVMLTETVNDKAKNIPCQLIEDEGRLMLLWVMEGKTGVAEKRTYTLTDKRGGNGNVMKADDKNGVITLRRGSKKILEYVHKITMPPAGVNPVYQRGGYIHPAYSPSGNVLTTIQPKDHYHHYGIWNPWTHLEYKGKIHDLWNLADKTGTVRYEKTTEMINGNIVGGFKAIHNNIVISEQGVEKNVMNEEWDVKSYNLPAQEALVWDFKTTYTPLVDEPMFIRAYRYGGFGYRACEEWTNQNSIMISSEGKSRQQIDGSRGRWIYTEGVCKNGKKSGILFMASPRNQEYPEPLRIWDENANRKRGDVFINFAPTKVTDWELKPGNRYVLKYRVATYDGAMTPERAEALWQDFAYPPYIHII